jgi:hypothetical protein
LQRQDAHQVKFAPQIWQNFVETCSIDTEIKHADRQARPSVTSYLYAICDHKVKQNTSEKYLHVEIREKSENFLRGKINGM